MKIRKFYTQTNRVVDGPKGKLNVLGLRKEIKEKEAQAILDNFFSQEASNAETVKAQAWALILKGEQVTVNDICISSLLFNVPDKRIANLNTTSN